MRLALATMAASDSNDSSEVHAAWRQYMEDEQAVSRTKLFENARSIV